MDFSQRCTWNNLMKRTSSLSHGQAILIFRLFLPLLREKLILKFGNAKTVHAVFHKYWSRLLLISNSLWMVGQVLYLLWQFSDELFNHRLSRPPTSSLHFFWVQLPINSSQQTTDNQGIHDWKILIRFGKDCMLRTDPCWPVTMGDLKVGGGVVTFLKERHPHGCAQDGGSGQWHWSSPSWGQNKVVVSRLRLQQLVLEEAKVHATK